MDSDTHKNIKLKFSINFCHCLHVILPSISPHSRAKVKERKEMKIILKMTQTKEKIAYRKTREEYSPDKCIILNKLKKIMKLLTNINDGM